MLKTMPSRRQPDLRLVSDKESYSSRIFDFQPGLHTLSNDNDHVAFLMIKRIKDGLQGDLRSIHHSDSRKALQELQKRFAHKLDVLPYKQLVEEGHIGQWLDDYLGLLIISQEHDKDAAQAYIEEREYYFTHPQLVKDASYRLKPLIMQQSSPSHA